MGNAEIVVRPLNAFTDNIQGVIVDHTSLTCMETVLATVQNIAQHRDRTVVLDGGLALYPIEALKLREELMHAARLAKLPPDSCGMLGRAIAQRIAHYLVLLQATERNKQTVALLIDERFSHCRPSGMPPSVTADPDSATGLPGIRQFRRRKLQEERDAQLVANEKWLQQEAAHKQKITEATLEADRGFEAARKLHELLR